MPFTTDLLLKRKCNPLRVNIASKNIVIKLKAIQLPNLLGRRIKNFINLLALAKSLFGLKPISIVDIIHVLKDVAIKNLN